MTPTCEVDLHSDSGYRRLSGDADDDVKGYGIRWANLLRRGNTPSGKPVVNLIYAYCRSHRLQPARGIQQRHGQLHIIWRTVSHGRDRAGCK
eukprot:959177-Pyramimonas_sp.AAC.1